VRLGTRWQVSLGRASCPPQALIFSYVDFRGAEN
jgi:hypothetical protein